MSDTETQQHYREEEDRYAEQQRHQTPPPPPNSSAANHGDLIPQPLADIDNYDKEITEDVVYQITDIPSYNETRALLIANLRPPFDNGDFQAMLSEEASKVDTEIERAWLNERRTHCIVIVSEVQGAAEIQKNLNGRYFPLTSDNIEPDPECDNKGNPIKRLQLYIDFIPVKATSLWIDQENKGPRDAIWKVEYVRQPSKQERDQFFLVATHTMLNYPNRTSGYKSSSSAPRRRRGGPSRRRDGGGPRSGRGLSYSSRPPRGYGNSRYASGPLPGSYGGYAGYPPPSDIDPYYYPPAQQQQQQQQQPYPAPLGYGGSRGGPSGYHPYPMPPRGGNGSDYAQGRNGYGGGRSSRGAPPPGRVEPMDGDDYRRERSPIRNRDRERGYGSRSPPANRSPEWAD